MKRTLHIFAATVFGAVALFGFPGPLQHAQGERAQGGDEEAGGGNAPTDKAVYFSHGDMETVWKDLEARQINSHRALANDKFVIYTRIVKPTSRALVHPAGADVWICEAGSAIAVTGGKLVNPKTPKGDNSATPSMFGNDTSGSAIEGGIEQAFMPGDILYVPPGVPHTFKDMKGFRAYLIRFDIR